MPVYKNKWLWLGDVSCYENGRLYEYDLLVAKVISDIDENGFYILELSTADVNDGKHLPVHVSSLNNINWVDY